MPANGEIVLFSKMERFVGHICMWTYFFCSFIFNLSKKAIYYSNDILVIIILVWIRLRQAFCTYIAYKARILNLVNIV